MAADQLERRVRDALHGARPQGVRAPDDLADRIVRKRRGRRVRRGVGVLVLAAVTAGVLALGPVLSEGADKKPAKPSPKPSPTGVTGVPEGWAQWDHPWVKAEGLLNTDGCAQDGAYLYCVGESAVVAKLEADTGDTVWSVKGKYHSVPGVAPGPIGVRDGVVYAYTPHYTKKTISTDVAAYDAETGDKLWNHQLHVMGFGMRSAGLIDGAILVVRASEDEGYTALTALDPRTGRDLWQFALDKSYGYQWVVANGDAYVVRTSGAATEVLRLDPATGEEKLVATIPVHPGLRANLYELWASDDTIAISSYTPSSPDDPVNPSAERVIDFVDVGTGKTTTATMLSRDTVNSLVNGLLLQNTESGTVTAISVQTGKQVWRSEAGLKAPRPYPTIAGPPLSQPVLSYDGKVAYLLNAEGRIAGIDLATGEVVWRHQLDLGKPLTNAGREPHLTAYGDVLIAGVHRNLYSVLPDAAD